MKSKILSLIAFVACLLTGFTSCSDNDDSTTPSQDTAQNEVADYTVIFWASAGNNESAALSDIAEMILAREDGKITDKINLVGCFDPSPEYHEPLAAKNLGGTIEFELGTKQNTDASVLAALNDVAGVENSLKLDELVLTTDYDFVSLYEKEFPAMKSIKANAEYDVYSSASLAQYITKAAKEHPAKKYVLILMGHGNGYYIPMDVNTDTRSCMLNQTDKSWLTLDDVTNAIQNSGVKIQTVVYNCCNMAALENFASMKNCTDYVMASVEPILNGFISTFLADLSQAGTTDEGMKNTCKKTVDHYKVNVADKCADLGSSSFGFYDLAMTDQLLSSVKKAAAWFETAAKANPQFMKDVVYNSVYVLSTSLENENEALSFENLHAYKELSYKVFSTGKLDVATEDELAAVVMPMMMLKDYRNTFGSCFASIMDAALSDKLATEAASLNLDELRTIYDEYLSTLKQMAYIRCNGSEADDVAYRFASPSVNLFSMNENGFFKSSVNFDDETEYAQFFNNLTTLVSKGDAEGAFNLLNSAMGATGYADSESLASIKAKYASTDFDKATGWSKVLENVNVNPSLAISPTRWDVTNK